MARRRISRRIRRVSKTPSEKKGEFHYRKVVGQMAENFRKRIREQRGTPLNYSLDELEFLDRYLQELRRKDEEETRETLLLLGNYFAEVLRRNIGGEYKYDTIYEELKLQCEGISCFPLLHVRNAVSMKETQPLQKFCFAFARKVSERRER